MTRSDPVVSASVVANGQPSIPTGSGTDDWTPLARKLAEDVCDRAEELPPTTAKAASPDVGVADDVAALSGAVACRIWGNPGAHGVHSQAFSSVNRDDAK